MKLWIETTRERAHGKLCILAARPDYEFCELLYCGVKVDPIPEHRRTQHVLELEFPEVPEHLKEKLCGGCVSSLEIELRDRAYFPEGRSRLGAA
jgi:hypothetical protein